MSVALKPADSIYAQQCASSKKLAEPFAQFKARVDGFIRALKQSELEAGATQILMPGEREFRLERERRRSGMPLPAALLAELEQMAEDLGVAPTWKIGERNESSYGS